MWAPELPVVCCFVCNVLLLVFNFVDFFKKVHINLSKYVRKTQTFIELTDYVTFDTTVVSADLLAYKNADQEIFS